MNGQAALSLGSIANRLLFVFPCSSFKTLHIDTLRLFMNAMTDLTCSFLQAVAKEEEVSPCCDFKKAFPGCNKIGSPSLPLGHSCRMQDSCLWNFFGYCLFIHKLRFICKLIKIELAVVVIEVAVKKKKTCMTYMFIAIQTELL